MKEINEGSKWCKYMDGGAQFTLYRAVGFYYVDWDFSNTILSGSSPGDSSSSSSSTRYKCIEE